MRALKRLALFGLPALILLGLVGGRRVRPPRHDAWRIVGPGGGGTMRRPAVSPHDPKVVVEGCDMTGAYITKDGGRVVADVQPRRAALRVRLRSQGPGRDLRHHGRALAKRGRGEDLDHGLPRPRPEHGGPRLDRPRGLRDHDRRPRLRGQRARRGHPRRGHRPVRHEVAGHCREQRRLAAPGLAVVADSPPGFEATRGRPGLAPGSSPHRARVRVPVRGYGGRTPCRGGGRDRRVRGRRREPGALRRRRLRAASPRRAIGRRRRAKPALRDDRNRRGAFRARGRPLRLRRRGPHLAGRERRACSRRPRDSARAKAGEMPRAPGRAWGRWRRPQVTAWWPTPDCAGSSGRPTGPSSTASRRPWTAAGPGPSSTRKRTDRRPTSKARGSRCAPRATGTRSGSTRPTTWPWLRPIPSLLRDRSLPHLPDPRRREDLGPGELGEDGARAAG